MSSPLQALEPQILWSHFDAIRKIPRPSKHEERIAQHIEDWAKERGFEVHRDAAGSMAVKVPATPGHGEAPTVILQGHLDMVCEKNADSDHDFMNDPIAVHVDGDWVRAQGTTLGADNGIGVATAMAAADDPEVVHGPLEILCTLDEDHSFYPRWRPHFVTALAPQDRCHLNGIAMVSGRPRYVTALGETDTPGGWRENKRDGGILMDVETNQVLLRRISMPHSPRRYEDRLRLLESGEGSLAVADLDAGTWQTVTKLPGYTRGIDFVGPLAFIGLSQVRETAIFSGIPLVERLKERICGVWVVNIQTGQTVAFLRFEEGVQEIFAVQAIRGIRFPEIMEWEDERLSHSYVLPDEALADVPREGGDEDE